MGGGGLREGGISDKHRSYFSLNTLGIGSEIKSKYKLNENVKDKIQNEKKQDRYTTQDKSSH